MFGGGARLQRLRGVNSVGGAPADTPCGAFDREGSFPKVPTFSTPGLVPNLLRQG